MYAAVMEIASMQDEVNKRRARALMYIADPALREQAEAEHKEARRKAASDRMKAMWAKQRAEQA